MDTQPSQFQNNLNRVETQPMPPKSNKKLITIAVVVILILAAGAAAYRYFISQKNPVACTQEAKQCPDGSFVGRSGLNCEFAACPQAKDETASWQTYRNEEYGFEIGTPQAWKDYNVSVNRCCYNISGDELNDFTYLGFSPKAMTRFEIFQITIFTKDQWNKWQSTTHKNELHILGQNNLYVIAIDNNQTNYTSNDCMGGGQYNEFEKARCMEVPQIIKTFQIIPPLDSFLDNLGTS